MSPKASRAISIVLKSGFIVIVYKGEDGLFQKAAVEVEQCVEDIAADMNEVVDADSFEVVHAGRSTGNDKFCAAVEIFEGCGSEFGIFVVARAEDNDVGSGCESGVDAFFHGLEAVVVDNLITGTAEEVARELGAGQTHGEIADREHEHFRTFFGMFGCKAESFEGTGRTGIGKALGRSCFFAVAASAGIRAGVTDDLVGGHFVDIGELVGSEQAFLATGDVGVAFGRGLADNALNLVVVDVGEETAVLFDFEEYFPCLFGDCYGESLNIIAAAGGIDNLVEVAFLLEKELLVAGYALAEIIGGLIADIERSCRYRVDTVSVWLRSRLT